MARLKKHWHIVKSEPGRGVLWRRGCTNDKYCVYDERHNDYGYTPAYVHKLIRECSTEQAFRTLLGAAPKDKVTGQWVGEPSPSEVTLPESQAS